MIVLVNRSGCDSATCGCAVETGNCWHEFRFPLLVQLISCIEIVSNLIALLNDPQDTVHQFGRLARAGCRLDDQRVIERVADRPPGVGV